VAKKILKWIGISLAAIGLLLPVVFFGAVYFIFWFAFNEEPTPYMPQPDGYWQKVISKEIALDVRDSEVLYEMDTHGGFLGDGTAKVTLKLSDSLAADVDDHPHWRKLPLPEPLNSHFVQLEDAKGYYLFMDRHSEAENVFDPSPLRTRYSQNYTLAVYDADENILYFLAVDT